MKHHVGQTRNGTQVYTDLIGSLAGKHIARQPQLLSLAKEMLATINLRDSVTSIEHDMKRPIGYSSTIETTDTDSVFYGRLIKDDIYTRFVKKPNPNPTQYLTITFTKASDDSYDIADIWIGNLMPPRPGSTDETTDSKTYWSNHAFIHDNQPIHTQTITKTCPY